MVNGNTENLTVDEITFSNSNILPKVMKSLLKTLVEKNVISNDDAEKIISESLRNNTEQMEETREVSGTSKNNKEFKDSREVLISQAGSWKDDETLDDLLDFIYQERGRSMTE